MTRKIKFIREAGYLPSCVIGDTIFSIRECGEKGCYDQDYDSRRPRFALTSRPVDNPSRTWGFTNKGDAFMFLNGICPEGKYLFRCGDRTMYRNDEWEVILTVHHNVFKDIDIEKLRQHRRKRIYPEDETSVFTECYYEITRRRAIKIIKEGLYDLKYAMDFTVKYLTQLLEQKDKALQPSLFD